eukprot:65557-Alexandrium_andersonii.AAC.1
MRTPRRARARTTPSRRPPSPSLSRRVRRSWMRTQRIAQIMRLRGLHCCADGVVGAAEAPSAIHVAK